MKLSEFAWLTDENIDPEVVRFLRSLGHDVLDVCDARMQGSADKDILRRAFLENRIVVTHDSDFGTLAIFAGEPLVGILYLRPGHIDPAFTIESIQAVFSANLDVTPPFVIVARRTGSSVAIRIRHLQP